MRAARPRRPGGRAAFVLLVTVFLFTAGCASESRTGRSDADVSIVVFAPHPDDETLGFGGLIHDAVSAGRGVRVVVVTDGDAYVDACYFWKNGCPRDSCPPGIPWESGTPSECTPEDLAAFGRQRREESRAALRLLGLPEENVTFWGYPDSKLAEMKTHPDSVVPAVSSNRLSLTGKPFSGRSLEEDIEGTLRRYPAATLYTTHQRDHHHDHSALAEFVQDARASIAAAGGGTRPCYWAVIHEPLSGRDLRWPPPACTWEPDFTRREERYTPEAELPPPEGVDGTPIFYAMSPELWDPARRTPPLLREAVDLYKSQYGAILRDGGSPDPGLVGILDESGYALAFVKRNHLFWEAPAP